MKKIVYFVLMCSLPVMAQNQELFQEGNTAYNKGDYKNAIEKYEQILESGETSAELYYNLANAHYKKNSVAPSIYYYEKALRLKPNDPDITNNLGFARNMLIDDIQEVPQTGVSAMVSNAFSAFSFDGWARMAVAASVLFGAFFLFYYFNPKAIWKRLFFSLTVIAVVVAVLSVFLGYRQYNTYQNESYAIIFAEETIVRSEPNLRSDELFRLHEGTKLEVLETYQDWIKFELSNGVQGWMERENLRFL